MQHDDAAARPRLASPCNILFLCTHNSARSIMAEAILNRKAFCLERPLGLRAFSAGDHPAAGAHPLALEQLKSRGYTTRFARPTDWRRFGAPGAPEIHLVIQLCRREPDAPAPAFRRPPSLLRWPFCDPAAARGDRASRRAAFAAVFEAIEARIDALLDDVRRHGPLSPGLEADRVARLGRPAAAG